MSIKIAKPKNLVFGLLSGLAVLSLGVLPGNANTSSSQMNKNSMNSMHKTGTSSTKSGTSSNSSAASSSSNRSTATQSSMNSGTLALGSSGQAVKDIQASLKRMGFYNGPIDGNFGPQTQAAVIKFQKSKNLTPDGVVGPKTRSDMV